MTNICHLDTMMRTHMPMHLLQVTAAHLFQQAQIALRFDDFDTAKDALRRAVRLEPTNGALLDAYACLLAELGEDAAQEALLQVCVIMKWWPWISHHGVIM